MVEISEQVLADLIKELQYLNDNLSSGSQPRGPIQDISQSAAQDHIQMGTGDRRSPYRRESEFKSRKPLDQFEEGLMKGLLDAVSPSGDFKKSLQAGLNQFTKQFGFNLNELPGKLGKEMAKQAANSGVGKELTGWVKKSLFGENKDSPGGLLGKVIGDVGKDSPLGGALTKISQSFLSGASGAGELGLTATEVSGALTQLAGMASTAFPPIIAALAVVAAAAYVLGPALEGLGEVAKSLGQSALRQDSDREKRREEAQKRQKADLEYMVQQPFKILTDAAQKWYDTWDNNLKKVSQIQGYDKQAVYNLYSSYAERLREEGLDSVISATSITDKLGEVLQQGLSGKAAEEFAYVATKLNNAIPNQDFFGYAASYAQIAANAVAQGKSQEEALSLANQQLETFASNLLFSSRELAGGFSTGLQNASQLFSDSVKIAQAARVTDTSNISGILTSVSAVVGAVAPELANGLVQNIVNAAIGGNDSSIVALRSLAGINASNTEFLNAFVSNPKAIFTQLFTKLAELQNMSNDNFMEVAEGLAPIFGVDKSALALVDFGYIAEAISQMQVNQNSLNANMQLLASGQSTTTAEQAKMREINEIILNDGLAVVMDNEAARVIQQHLWDEQLAVEMQNATYAVNLQGSALQFLEGLSQTVTNLLRIFNPIGTAYEMIANIAYTVEDSLAQQTAISDILINGAVKTNTEALDKLTNTSGTSSINVFGHPENIDYNNRLGYMLYGAGGIHSTSRTFSNLANIASDIVGVFNPLGGPAGSIISGINAYNDITSVLNGGNATTSSSIADSIVSGIIGGVNSGFNSINRNSNRLAISDSISSIYRWGTVSKSATRMYRAPQEIAMEAAEAVADRSAQDAAAFSEKISKSIDATNQAVLSTTADELGNISSNIEYTNDMTYAQWRTQQYSELGIAGATEEERHANFISQLAEYGMSEEQLISRFQDVQAKSQSKITEQRANEETAFYADGRNMMKELRGFWDFQSAASGQFETVIWNPFFTALSGFWGGFADNGYQTKFWDPFYADGKKFDQGITKLFNEIVNVRDKWIGDTENADTVRGLLNTINDTLIAFNDTFTDWVTEWTDFYINHTTYSARTASADWSEMVSMEQAASRDTALALAQSLESISDLDSLKDPTVQSNVLLSKIVVILEAMMQQNNSAGGLSLIDTISAMGLGLTVPTQ